MPAHRSSVKSPRLAAEKFMNQHHVEGYTSDLAYLWLFNEDDTKSCCSAWLSEKVNGISIKIIRYAESLRVIKAFTRC
jgi:hypothetical protein